MTSNMRYLFALIIITQSQKAFTQESCDTLMTDSLDVFVTERSYENVVLDSAEAEYLIYSMKLYNTIKLIGLEDSIFSANRDLVNRYINYFENILEPFLKENYGFTYSSGFGVMIKKLGIRIRGNYTCQNSFVIKEHQSCYRSVEYRD